MFLWIALWWSRCFGKVQNPETAGISSTAQQAASKESWGARWDRWRIRRRNASLINAANAGHDWKVNLLIQKYGANPNFVDKHGMTPLLYAIDRRKDETVTCLMRNGASPDPVANHLQPYQNKGTDTKDPVRRAMQKALLADTVWAIIRCSTSQKRLRGYKRLLRRGAYAQYLESKELIAMAIDARIAALTSAVLAGSTSTVAQFPTGESQVG